MEIKKTKIQKIMHYQLDYLPTRESMIEEFDITPNRLRVAEEAIRDIAKSEAVELFFDWEKVVYDASEVGYLLIEWGLVEAFALFCLRTGYSAGLIGVVDASNCFADVEIEAEFEPSGKLKSMSGRKLVPDSSLCKYFGVTTVIRFRLSRTQAYRKLLAERWYDPGVSVMDRFVCPLDRQAFENFRYMEGKSIEVECGIGVD